jgi:hypothetical protein
MPPLRRVGTICRVFRQGVFWTGAATRMRASEGHSLGDARAALPQDDAMVMVY